jgi:Zn-dependent protease with chaperone function
MGVDADGHLHDDDTPPDAGGQRPYNHGHRRQRDTTSSSAPVLGYAIGAILLVGYFVWMCSEMARHASNGSALPISIFGGVLIGVVAGAAGLISRRRSS